MSVKKKVQADTNVNETFSITVASSCSVDELAFLLCEELEPSGFAAAIMRFFKLNISWEKSQSDVMSEPNLSSSAHIFVSN